MARINMVPQPENPNDEDLLDVQKVERDLADYRRLRDEALGRLQSLAAKPELSPAAAAQLKCVQDSTMMDCDDTKNSITPKPVSK